ncbi:MAG: hypothetical protein ACOZCO_14385 [Bacteroidota bacterium]
MNSIIIIISFFGTLLLFQCCNWHAENNEVKKEMKEDERTCVKVDSLCHDTVIVNYCKEFSEDGMLIREGLYFNNKPFRMHKFYSETGKIQCIREYLVTPNKPYLLNRIFKINENGDTIKLESNYYTLLQNRNRLQVGDTLIVNINLIAPYFNSNNIIVFLEHPDYPDEYQYELPAKNNKAKFYYITKTKGNFSLQGTIREYPETTSEAIARDLIFFVDFTVE